MKWQLWVIAGLVVVNAGWMLFDGARALVVGDYVTPRSGAHAGGLGPWSKVAEAVGVDPRSSLMKWIFVVYGALSLGAMAALLAGAPGAWWALLILSFLGLWHLPFGALINCIVIALLLSPGVRSFFGP